MDKAKPKDCIMIPRLLLTALLLAEFGCSQAGLVPDLAHNSRNALDWPGQYTGLLPCADCEGINTSLSLAADGTYLVQWLYLGRSEEIFESHGSFTWTDDGNRIVLDSDSAPNQYQVGENRLIQLDMAGQRIEGTLAGRYILQRAGLPPRPPPFSLTGLRWELVSFLGEARGESLPRPWIEFGGNGLVNGFAGCNTFGGAYTRSGPNGLRFGELMSTLMACLEPGMDDALLEILPLVDNYSSNGGNLSLNRSGMAAVAVFRPVLTENN
jgi:copper homeostasis protein (lipoprotein)